jgi:hypothetical protein
MRAYSEVLERSGNRDLGQFSNADFARNQIREGERETTEALPLFARWPHNEGLASVVRSLGQPDEASVVRKGVSYPFDLAPSTSRKKRCGSLKYS